MDLELTGKVALITGHGPGSVLLNRKSASAAIVLGAVVLAFALAAGVGGARTTAAQSDPYSGLTNEVKAVGEAVRSGDLERILAALPTDGTPVVAAAFPGSGGEVSLETARQEIAALVVSDPSQLDSFGNGVYTLLAIWRPSIRPSLVVLIGSGIRPDGVRVSTGFGVSVTGGRTSITSYGWILDLTATLAQFAGQGDLRLIPREPPSSPASGSGPPGERAPGHLIAPVGAAMVLVGAATVAAVALRASRRRAR